MEETMRSSKKEHIRKQTGIQQLTMQNSAVIVIYAKLKEKQDNSRERKKWRQKK